MLGFSWSKLNGLKLVVGFGDLADAGDMNGEPMPSSTDSLTRLIVGKPSNESAKYFQGTVDSIAVYYGYKEEQWMKNFLKASGKNLDVFMLNFFPFGSPLVYQYNCIVHNMNVFL